MDTQAVDTIIDRYISIWNEVDAHARKTKIDQVFTPEATYIDPTIVARGADAINEYVANAQPIFTGMLFSHGAILTHHNAVHFSWQVGPKGCAPVVSGFDFAMLDGKRITQIYGFFNAS
ncbi:nuclear transport factor 2 family protein [Natronoglycomyces albus]|uniref:Nuclear transport factor 2 family protein n=1 Tax=Natronoglycomyces albus TaxID=2811108 RepID=A0A895XY03_9ACTN|nr:nuclear transport factor 2 family protein [Natronoglycomyces albus]QSB06498.1 nuclear transport factor 2 family protein [Natronoglycomyces albus]